MYIYIYIHNVLMDGRNYGWMDGRTDGWMDGWMDMVTYTSH